MKFYIRNSKSLIKLRIHPQYTERAKPISLVDTYKGIRFLLPKLFPVVTFLPWVGMFHRNVSMPRLPEKGFKLYTISQ